MNQSQLVNDFNDYFHTIVSESDKQSATELRDGIDTICEVGDLAWAYLRLHPDETQFDQHCVMFKKITSAFENKPTYYNHSGGSFMFVMRQLEYIAKFGFDEFKLLYSEHKVYADWDDAIVPQPVE